MGRGAYRDTPLLCEKAGSVKLRAAYPVGHQAVGARGRCSRWENFVYAAARVPAQPTTYATGHPVHLEKAHTDPSALICTHWDHRQGRFVKGLNFGRLRYQASALALPIAVELIANLFLPLFWRTASYTHSSCSTD